MTITPNYKEYIENFVKKQVASDFYQVCRVKLILFFLSTDFSRWLIICLPKLHLEIIIKNKN